MRKIKRLKNGKLPNPLLSKLLKKIKGGNALLGPAIGEDAAMVLSKDLAFIFTLDPITFTDKDIGRYLLNVNANDIAACGGIPKYLYFLFFSRRVLRKNK